jgi:protein TonB
VENRALTPIFRYAVLASIALHGVALFGISSMKESANSRAAAPVPIEARLAEPEPVAPVVKSVARRALTSKSVSKPVPAQEAVANSKPAPAPAPAPVATPVAAAPIADATTVGQYRMQLIDAAKRYKRYPEVARENNWAGNVVVGVAVGADGRAQASVRKSSGRPVLDEQALEMFQQAAKAVPVPPALRGREFSLEVRAIYGLED